MRNTHETTIEAEGRDKGKRYLLTEMSAQQGEEWALRALGVMVRNGAELPDADYTSDTAWMAVAALGFKALLGAQFHDQKPLLDELMDCVKIIVDPTRPEATTRTLVDSDIEEVATRLRLKVDVFKLHSDFSSLAAPSTSTPARRQTAGSAAT